MSLDVTSDSVASGREGSSRCSQEYVTGSDGSYRFTLGNEFTEYRSEEGGGCNQSRNTQVLCKDDLVF
jgi:hypothetical protein